MWLEMNLLPSGNVPTTDKQHAARAGVCVSPPGHPAVREGWGGLWSSWGVWSGRSACWDPVP